MATLYELTGQYRELLELASSGEVDIEVLNDTMEGIGGELEVKADGYAKIMKELDGQSSMLKAEIDRLSGRKSSIENNIKAMKESLESAMKATGKVKFKTDLFSFSIQKNPSKLVVDDPKNIPQEYLIPQEPKIDSAKIKDELKNAVLPFAHLEQGESLRIR